MMYKTHLLFAFLVGLFLVQEMNFNSIFFIFLVLVSSFIPDIDTSNSKIGREFRVSSFVLNKLFSHRGFFHSLLLPLLFYFLFRFLVDYNQVAMAIFSGTSSHLFLDLMTKEGISLFAPFSKIRIRGFIRTNGLLEKIFFVVLLFLVVFLIAQKFFLSLF